MSTRHAHVIGMYTSTTGGICHAIASARMPKCIHVRYTSACIHACVCGCVCVLHACVRVISQPSRPALCRARAARGTATAATVTMATRWAAAYIYMYQMRTSVTFIHLSVSDAYIYQLHTYTSIRCIHLCLHVLSSGRRPHMYIHPSACVHVLSSGRRRARGYGR